MTIAEWLEAHKSHFTVVPPVTQSEPTDYVPHDNVVVMIRGVKQGCISVYHRQDGTTKVYGAGRNKIQYDRAEDIMSLKVLPIKG